MAFEDECADKLASIEVEMNDLRDILDNLTKLRTSFELDSDMISFVRRYNCLVNQRRDLRASWLKESAT